MIDKSTTDLCDILEKKKKVDDETDVISKLKLRLLLEKHSLKNLNLYVIQFVKNIQNLVGERKRVNNCHNVLVKLLWRFPLKFTQAQYC